MKGTPSRLRGFSQRDFWGRKLVGVFFRRVIKHTKIQENLEDIPILRQFKFLNARKRASVAPALLLEVDS